MKIKPQHRWTFYFKADGEVQMCEAVAESREAAEAAVRKAYPNGIKVFEVDDDGECDEDGELIAFDENGDPI